MTLDFDWWVRYQADVHAWQKRFWLSAQARSLTGLAHEKPERASRFL